MRTFFIVMFTFLIAQTFIKADYLNTKSSNQCVYNVEPYQDHKGLCYTKRSNDSNHCSESLRYKHLVDGYEYIDNGCYLKHDLKALALTENQFNYQMAFIGNLMGFSFLFMISFIAVLIARK